jgi:hypothetical protein
LGTGTLNDKIAGATIFHTDPNEIHAALNTSLVGRNSSGVPTAGQELGTAAIPWGTVRAGSLIIGGSSVDVSQVSAPPFRVLSGLTRTTSNQPAFIDANGAAASFVVEATATDLVFDVNGTTFTMTADVTKSSLTLAPSTNNTALVNDSTAVDQDDTRMWGEPWHRKAITIDTIGTEISTRNGQIASFKIDNGTTTEFFLALIDTTNNRLINCRRGFFYDPAKAPKNRIFFSDNDVITLMSTAWVFMDSNLGTVDVTYKAPVWDSAAPGSPATGDYWYDTVNSLWKRYDGATFASVDRTWIGYAVIDSANCVAARCVPFDNRYQEEDAMSLEVSTTEIVVARSRYQKVNVAGNEIFYGEFKPSWNITTDLATSADMYNATEQASTYYYLYVKDDGAQVISDIAPYFGKDEFYGYYHPHNPWRCVGSFFNNASSNIIQAGSINDGSRIWVHSATTYPSTATRIRRYTTLLESYGGKLRYDVDSTLGSRFTVVVPGRYTMHLIDEGTGATVAGISLNATVSEQATNLNAIAAANKMCFASDSTVAYVLASVTRDLLVGDVLRSHDQATGDTAATDNRIFAIVEAH